MLFVDDLKWAINVMLHPKDATNETMDSIGAFLKYYKASLIPVIIAVIFEILLGGFLAATLVSIVHSAIGLLLGPVGGTSSYYGGLLVDALGEFVGIFAVALLIVGTLFFVWVAVPVNFIFWSLVYFIIGRWLLKVFKNEYDNTATAFVYSAAPFAVFAWVIVIPLLNLILVPLLVGWQFVILVYSLANQEAISKKMAGALILVTGIIGWIVGLFLGGI